MCNRENYSPEEIKEKEDTIGPILGKILLK